MTEPALEDLEGSFLDEPCMNILGDTIQFKPSGGAYASLKAYVDYRDMAKGFESGQAIVQDMTAQILISSVGARPTGSDRITLPKISGKYFKPVNVRRDESGTHWEFELEEVSA